jgi:carboxyl-terminal processing protease
MGITRRNVLTLGSLAAFGAWPAYSQPVAQPDASPVEARRTTFDEVWETVRDRFYDRDLRGLDWPAVRRRYQPMADAADTREQLAVVINAMLAELATSHTQFYTPEDTAYYQLVDIFIDSLRRHGLDRIFPSGEVTYSGIGAFTNEDDQRRSVVTGIVEDTPAHQAGLLVGDEILAADDLPFRPVASFRGEVGVPVTLSVRRDPGGPPMALSVTPVATHPNAMFLRGGSECARSRCR